jgi:hypothetical protein
MGDVVSVALVSAVGDARAFGNGRDLAAWLGIGASPSHDRRQAAAGRHQQARQPLPAEDVVHGARVVLPKLAERDTPMGRWLRDLLAHQH